MHKNVEIGKTGEDEAANFLRKKGYRILFQNKRWPWGELDIICRDKGVLVFVEVKALVSEDGSANPEQNYSFDKDCKTKRTSQMFVEKNPHLVSVALGYRIDLVAVVLLPDGSVAAIRHYENV